MNIHLDPSDLDLFVEAIASAVVRRLKAQQSKDDNGKVLVSKGEAARLLGVSVATVDRWRREAGLPFLKVDGLVMLRPEALHQWAKKVEGKTQ